MRVLFLCLMISIHIFAEEIITQHAMELKTGPLAYTARVGSLPQLDAKGEKKGEISYIAYIKDPFDTTRPITFAFNGGPGAASIWLHMGTFGPRRVATPEEGQLVTPPYAIHDNPETILDLTDIVFIDPMSTGFSKPITPEEGKIFYSIEGDVHSVGDFIRDFVTENKRWNSPKFIAGESYGTFRACGLAHYLQSEYGMYLNGLILVSCVIDFQTVKLGNEENLLPLFLSMPTYATTAWYHGKHSREISLEEVANKAKEFAYKQYAPWLLQPYAFSQREQDAILEQLSALSGIDTVLLRRLSGRLDPLTFRYSFFPDQRKIVGRFDSRFVGDFPSKYYINDPSLANVEGIFVGAFLDYLQGELGKSGFYASFSEEANRQWDFSSKERLGYPNFFNELRYAMTDNPELKVFVGSGYFDLATPFAATDYCFDHLDLPESYMNNVQREYYDGGHMYYLNPEARKKFKKDLIRFYTKQNSEEGTFTCGTY